MGCKCTNSNEEEDEINKNVVEDGNDAQSPNDFNNNFNKDENLLGFNNQENVNQELNNNQDNQIENSNNDQPYNIDENAFFNIQNVPLQYNKYSDYPEKIVELINNIREDPVGYADVIEDSIKYIVEEEDKNDPSNARLIFKKKVKVALNRGESAFREAADYLRTLTQLPPLEFRQEKCVPLPENEDELKDPTFLREQVRQIREHTEVDVFFKDLIKIPEISGLLMIVDDTNKNAGKKRLALLNKDIKYVGVTSKFIGKTFIAYFAFSK
jgi:hypothetical protein